MIRPPVSCKRLWNGIADYASAPHVVLGFTKHGHGLQQKSQVYYDSLSGKFEIPLQISPGASKGERWPDSF